MTESTCEIDSFKPLLGNAGRWSRIVAPVLLSKAEFFKLLAMILLVSRFFGLPGIFFLACMHILRILRLGGDSAEKYGIGTLPSSRLGGLAIAIMIGFNFITSA